MESLQGVYLKQYIPVSTKFISSFKEALPFDVFIERSDGKFTAIYKKNSAHDDLQIARYESVITFQATSFKLNLKIF